MDKKSHVPYWIPALTVGYLYLALEFSVDLWMAPWGHPDLQVPFWLLLVSAGIAALLLSTVILLRSFEVRLVDHPFSPLILLLVIGGVTWAVLIGPDPAYTSLLVYLIPVLLAALFTAYRTSTWNRQFHWLCCLVMVLGAPGLLKALHLAVYPASSYRWRGVLIGVCFALLLTFGGWLYGYLARRGFFRMTPALLSAGLLVVVLGVHAVESPDDDFQPYFNGSIESWTVDETAARPNIILISVDALRWDVVPPRGRHLELPNLQVLRRDSLSLEAAFSTSTWTLPAHVSLFSGLLPSQHGASFGITRAAPSTPFYTQYLQKMGYATGAFTDGLVMRKELGYSRGFDTYWERPIAYGGYVPGSLAIARRIFPDLGEDLSLQVGVRTYGDEANREPLRYFDRNVDEAFEWLERQQRTPFFLFLHTYQVHDWKAKYPHTIRRIKKHRPCLLDASCPGDENPYSRKRALYDYGIEILDGSMGRLIRRLKEKGFYEDTLIVFTSDHGEFGTGVMFPHGRGQLQESLLRIPLWVKLPGQQRAGETIHELVQITDVFPMVFEYLGINPLPAPPEGYPTGLLTDGSSDTPTKGRDFVRGTVNDGSLKGEGTEQFPLRFFVRSDQYKYTRSPLKAEQKFYRVHSDSLDETVVDPTDVPPGQRERLHREMKRLLRLNDEQFQPYLIEDIEPSVQRKLKGMGYL